MGKCNIEVKLVKKLIFNRFGVPGRLFMLGLAISAFVLLNIADVISRVQKEEAGINRFAYSEVYWVRPEDTSNFHLKAPSLTPEIISAIQSVECNVSFYELPIYVNHQIDFMQAELIMNLPEDLRLTSRDKKPIHIPETENGIVIGESMIELTENGEGKILDLGDIKVPVAEVLKDDNPAKIDYSMYMFRENADESFREYLTSRITERLEEMFLQVRFFGDDPIDNDVRKFTEAMSELGLVCEPVGSYLGLGWWGHDYQNLWYRMYNIIVLPICIVFAVFTCFTTSYLWIRSREKEISIRKAYGYGSFRILSLVIKEGLFLTLPALGAAVVLQFIMCLATHSLDFFDIFFILKLLFVGAGMLLITVLCAVRQIKRIGGISPAAALKDA